MQIAKARSNTDKARDSQSRGKSVQAKKTPPTKPGTHSLWHGMATGVQIQHKCSACEKEEHAQKQTPFTNNDSVQKQSTEAQDTDLVQMWSCGEYTAPQCTVQKKEDESELIIQHQCSTCESQETLQNQVESADNETADIQQYARYGIANARQSLPYQDQIQQAFGHHDVSSVQVQVGGPAAEAGARMGALAYTSGERIAFRQFPSLHLAAHETAHVIQQRSGLTLPGNVGKAGDRWERHADDVANKVVAGESAEALLDDVTPVSQLSAQTDHQHHVTSVTVQHRITSAASWQQESPMASDTVGATADIGQTPVDTPDKSGKAGEEQTDTDQAANEGSEGIDTEEATDPKSACEKSEDKDNNKNKSKQTAQKPPEDKPPPTVQKGRCYKVGAKAPPENAKKPTKDAPPNEVKEDSEVSFPKWEEPNDTCECEVGNELNQQAGGEGPGQTIATAQLTESNTTASATTTADQSDTASTQDQVSHGSEVAAQAGTAANSDNAGSGSVADGDNSTTGQMMAGEVSRDSAVDDFYAAYGEVDSIPSRTQQLSQGLEFAGASRGSAEQEVQKEQALSQIREFMLGAESQIADAVAFVRDDVPSRLGAMAEFAKSDIAFSMEEQKASISTRIGHARALATTQAIDARAQIAAAYETHVSTVNTQTDAALEALNKAYTTSTQALSKREETVLGEINSKYLTGREDHDKKGKEKAGKAIGIGQEWVGEYEKCKVNDKGVKYGDDGFWDGCLSVRRAKAQQDAACKTASATAKGMIELAQQTGFNLREQRTQHRCAAVAGAGHAQKTLDMAIEQLSEVIEKGRGDTLASLAHIREMNLAAVDGALTATLGRLDQQEYTQRQAVNDSGYIQQVAVEQLAHQTAASLARSVSSAMLSLEMTLGQLRDQLTQGDVPDAQILATALASAEMGLGGGVGTLLEKMEEGASNAENQLLDAGFNAVDALQQITNANDSQSAEVEQGFSSKMTTLINAANTTMATLADKHVKKAQESVQKGTDSMQKLVAGYQKSTEAIYKQADKAIKDSLDKLGKDLDKKLEELPARIASEAWKAAAKEQPAWKGVVAIVLIILVIIASIVISVVTLGAGAPFLAVVLVGAVVGAITAGLIQVINNWAAGEDLSKGVGTAMLMGAIGGALGGAIGAGANGIAQAAVQGAVRAGASRATQIALNIGINFAGDMLSEGLTQGVGYVAFGQKFNWQGFVMAGGMSVASTARGGLPGGSQPGGNPRANVPDVDVPMPRGHPVVKDSLIDLGIGMGLAGSVEFLSYLQTGKYDANRFFSSAASGAAGAKAASRGRAQADHPSVPRAQTDAPSTPATTRPQVDSPAVTTPKPQTDTAAPPTTPKLRTDAPDAPIASGPKTNTPDVPTTRLGRLKQRAGNLRDAAFSKMEISDDSRANQGTRKMMESVEHWFAGGAGGLIGNKRVATDGVPAVKPRDGGDTSPIRQQDSDPPAIKPQDTDDVRSQTDAKTGDSAVDAPIKQPQAETNANTSVRNQVDANTPIKNMSDAEMAALTKTQVKVGDADHDVSMRKRSDNDIECEICSVACGPVKQKIGAIKSVVENDARPKAQELNTDLDTLSAKVVSIEAKIEGRKIEGSEAGGTDGVYQAGKDVIRMAGEIAVEFQQAGLKHKGLGEAINDPPSILKELFPLTGGATKNTDGSINAVDLTALPKAVNDKLQVRPSDPDNPDSPKVLDTTVITDPEKFASAVSLVKGQEAIYVFRGPDGMILKVGKTSSGGMTSRFTIYKNAVELARQNGVSIKDFQLEVTPLSTKYKQESDSVDVESVLRNKMMEEGHIMPWDNTSVGNSGGRLNRPGPGVPGERILGPHIKLQNTDTNEPIPTTTSRVREPSRERWRGLDIVPVEGAPPIKVSWEGQPEFSHNLKPVPGNMEEVHQYLSNLLHRMKREKGGNKNPTSTELGAKLGYKPGTNMRAILSKQTGKSLTELLAMPETAVPVRTKIEGPDPDTATTTKPQTPEEVPSSQGFKGTQPSSDVIPRQGDNDCGPACAVTALKQQEVDASQRDIADAAIKVNASNTDPSRMADTMSRQMPADSHTKFVGGRLRVDDGAFPDGVFASLTAKDHYWIMQIKPDDSGSSRYIIIDKMVNDSDVRILDPSTGVEATITRQELMTYWERAGYGLVFPASKNSKERANGNSSDE
ncbi:hypothetical protein AB835_00620 [Candidatus Endobugula sertula]|uniref:eCIS core domain-containing protein n=1 Tax=Candidatus Endobugula sertula TaxID=62101 RepID=A0A1D2QTX6_9GAMM|nr:hypothetical protein AB835_00620 [Candidatus Endobugula sertula]